ncbi:MAG: cation:proton antiporter, partial [Alphaproteobacteria bacterium]|nr:cation:proton antiporter [Alphaproteobacteria bacterium]
MFSFYELFVFIAIFLIVALASEQFGKWFAKINLPLITGFLFTGIIAGPYVLGMIPEKAVTSLRFIDDIALAFIAFAAGCELIIDEMKGAMKSIKWVTICLVICTFVFGSTATFFLTDYLSFAQSFSVEGKIAVSILAGAILVARSPSSAIAIIKELRARGSFTRTVLGVTVIMDVVVIVLFSISLSIAFAIISDSSINLAFFGLLCLELLISPVIGYLVARILCFILSLKKIRAEMRTYLILALGYGVFIGADFVSNLSAEMFSFHFRPEPLLICMVGAFIVTNFSEYGSDLNNILHRVGHMVYVAFFTLTGAALTLSILT